jgi:hypothetical protein
LLTSHLGRTYPSKIPEAFIDHFRSYGIAVEIAPSTIAAGTFNILNEEGRDVVAALLTLDPVDIAVDVTELLQG